jgi:RNA polymerase sigma factor for flagellar operon FliA
MNMLAMEDKDTNNDIDSNEEYQLWVEFAENRDDATRQILIEKYLDFARSLAFMMYKKRTIGDVDHNDYIQYAMVGLIEAVDKYKPDSPASFKTFSSYRIRGAILNGLEKTSELAAQISFKKKLKQQRLESISSIDNKDSKDLMKEMTELTILLAIDHMLESSSVSILQTDLMDNQPYQKYEIKQMQEKLIFLLDVIPDNHRKVIKYHYLGQMTFDDIGTILGVTKGRVSQIHKEALTLLRTALKELDKLQIEY